MKLRHIALAAFAVAVSTPALAASVVVDTVSRSASSPSVVFPAQDSKTSYIALSAGSYTLDLLTSGFTSNYGNIFSQIAAVSTIDGSVIASVASLDNFKTTGSLAGSFTATFTVSSATNVVYRWLNNVSVNAGDGSLTATLSKEVVAVPGPEAGAGVSALAMAGVGAMVYRRKQKQAA